MHTVEMAAIRDGDLNGARQGDTLGAPAPLTAGRTAALVAAGGALGAMGRWVIELLLPATLSPTLIVIPWGTFTANVLGCFALGVVTGVLEVRPRTPTWVSPFLGLGVCGSFTTVSGVALQIAATIGADFPLAGLQYGLGTVVTALVGVVAGLALGRRAGRR